MRPLKLLPVTKSLEMSQFLGSLCEQRNGQISIEAIVGQPGLRNCSSSRQNLLTGARFELSRPDKVAVSAGLLLRAQRGAGGESCTFWPVLPLLLLLFRVRDYTVSACALQRPFVWRGALGCCLGVCILRDLAYITIDTLLLITKGVGVSHCAALLPCPAWP